MAYNVLQITMLQKSRQKGYNHVENTYIDYPIYNASNLFIVYYFKNANNWYVYIPVVN